LLSGVAIRCLFTANYNSNSLNPTLHSKTKKKPNGLNSRVKRFTEIKSDFRAKYTVFVLRDFTSLHLLTFSRRQNKKGQNKDTAKGQKKVIRASNSFHKQDLKKVEIFSHRFSIINFWNELLARINFICTLAVSQSELISSIQHLPTTAPSRFRPSVQCTAKSCSPTSQVRWAGVQGPRPKGKSRFRCGNFATRNQESKNCPHDVYVLLKLQTYFFTLHLGFESRNVLHLKNRKHQTSPSMRNLDRDCSL
jgi:hypothetical protein